MTPDRKQELRDAVREAQARYESDSAAARRARQEEFRRAQTAGLSLREIAEVVGLHHSRVGQIIEGQ